MTAKAGGRTGVNLLIVRIGCLLVATAPLIAAAVAAPVVDLAPAPTADPRVVATAPTADGESAAPEDESAEQVRRAERRAGVRLDAVAERTHFAVSMLDEKSGATFDHGTGRFQTASLVKIHLAALMLWRADDTGVALLGPQRTDIRQMLVRSENEPALRAYFALGGPSAIERDLARAFGQTRIEVGRSSYWGRTTTRPRDVVALLRTVLSTDGEPARRYALLQSSMARVVPDLRWGITALADSGSRPQVKVGFVDSASGWVVNSSGRVLVDGSPVLVSVMSDRNPTVEAGIAAIEDVARRLAPVVRAQRDHAEAISRREAHPERCFSARPPTSPC